MLYVESVLLAKRLIERVAVSLIVVTLTERILLRRFALTRQFLGLGGGA